MKIEPVNWDLWFNEIEKRIGRKMTDEEKEDFALWVKLELPELLNRFVRNRLRGV